MRRTAAAVAALAALAAPLGCATAPPEQAGLAASTPRSALGDDVTTGTPVSLAAYRGEVVLVVGYGSWCQPCQSAVEDVAAVHARTGVQVIGVSLHDQPAEAQAYADEHGLDFPVVADPDGAVLEKLAGAAVDAVPLTLVLDRRGRVADSLAGAVLTSTLEDEVASLSPQH